MGVLVCGQPHDLTNGVFRNGRTPRDLTKLSVISIEILLICVECQFRIPAVTQVSKRLIVDFVSPKA